VIRFGLKTNLAVNLLVLLVVAMFLLDMVVISILKRSMIRAELSTFNFCLQTIADDLMRDKNSPTVGSPRTPVASYFRQKFQRTGFLSICIDNGKRILYLEDKSGFGLQQVMAEISHQAITTNQRVERLIGHVWGVFWKDARFIAVAHPVNVKGDSVLGISAVIPLAPIYKKLRQEQRLLLVYIVVNALVLTFTGLYFISRLAVLPLQRLLRRARQIPREGYTCFSDTIGGSEFSQLSKALNQILLQMSDDNIRLKSAVSSLEQTNCELVQAQKEIVRAEKLASIGRMSSGIAHEIGNPIGIVLGYLDLLKQDNLSREETEDYIARVESEIDRINHIIRRLLDFSRPDHAEPVLFHVHPLIQDAIEMVQHNELFGGIDIALQFDATVDDVFADPAQFRQVLLNILINSADAIRSLGDKRSGRIVVSTQVMDNAHPESEAATKWLQIICSDNGPGIPDQHMNCIFDPFFTSKDPGKGTGLGLSVSFSLIQNMGGRVSARNRKRYGVDIELMLPVHSSVESNYRSGVDEAKDSEG